MEDGNSSPKIAILAVANNVDEEIKKRFLWAIGESEKDIPFDVYLGWHRNEEQQFHKTVILNDLLRRTLRDYEVIVQTDIDMLIPRGLVRETYFYCRGKSSCYHCNYRLINPKELKGKEYKKIPWNDISNREIHRASGSWNGMSSDSWISSGGFCEAIALLGGPDSEFYIRTKKNHLHWYITDRFPLCHVNHPKRKVKKRGEKNMRIARSFPKNKNWIRSRNESVCKTKISLTSFRNRHG